MTEDGPPSTVGREKKKGGTGKTRIAGKQRWPLKIKKVLIGISETPDGKGKKGLKKKKEIKLAAPPERSRGWLMDPGVRRKNKRPGGWKKQKKVTGRKRDWSSLREEKKKVCHGSRRFPGKRRTSWEGNSFEKRKRLAGAYTVAERPALQGLARQAAPPTNPTHQFQKKKKKISWASHSVARKKKTPTRRPATAKRLFVGGGTSVERKKKKRDLLTHGRKKKKKIARRRIE